ncbi:hypothetical protein FRB98_001333 [Tulasnella sp. 332]|nr:hypothetical protein FRB98_001333 [Tulasnella sp. 332]
MVSDLPLFSLPQAKSILPVEKWTQIIHTLARTLETHTKQSQTGTQHTTKTFIEFYLHNAATEIINQPSLLTRPSTLLTKSELAVRSQVLLLAKRAETSLSHGALLDLSIVYQKANELPAVKEIIDSQASSFNPVLRDKLIPAFIDILKTPFTAGQATPSTFIQTRLKLVRSMNGLVRSESRAVLICLSLHRDFLLALMHCYQVTLAEVAYARGGVRARDEGLSADWQQPWVETKIGILDIFHSLIDYTIRTVFAPSSPSSSSEQKEAFFDILLSLIDGGSSKTNNPDTAQWFVDVPLLMDYEHTYRLSNSLRDASKGEEPMVDILVTELESLPKPSDGSDAAGGLVIILRDLPQAETTREVGSKGEGKGKGKSKAVDPLGDLQQDAMEDHDIELAITQVLDLFPDENRAFVHTALQDPAYDHSAEKLIAALLEETLHPNLTTLRAKTVSAPAGEDESEEEDEGYERRNVFDDEEIDISRVQIGKNRSANADLLLQDKSFMADMKADILRRAAEHSSDEEEDGDTGGQGRNRAYHDIAFEEELDIDAEPRVKIGSVDGGGFSDDDSDEQERPKDVKPDPEEILVIAYSRDPKLFDRDGATRRSKARADLRAQTGWVDEQIEGWRIMLDRNPRKDKLLEKQALAASKAPQIAIIQPRAVQYSATDPGGPGRGQGSRGRGGAPGGRGRGDGGGGRGSQQTNSDPQTARDRAWKEKTGNKARQRGHDKKVARGGAGGPPIS